MNRADSVVALLPTLDEAARAKLLVELAPHEREAAAEGLAEQARGLSRQNPQESLRIARIAREAGAPPSALRTQALTLRAEAIALWALGEFRGALARFEAGAEAARTAGERLLAAQIPLLAIETLAQLERYEEALDLAGALEAELRALGADGDAAKAVANAGNIHFQRDRLADALACWERARADFAAAGNRSAEASVLVNIGNVHTLKHEIPAALGAYTYAAEVLAGAGMEAVLAGIEGNMGYLHFLVGDYSDAIRCYQRARSRFTHLGLKRDVGRCDHELGHVYLEVNLLPEAREAYQRALPILTQYELYTELARAEIGQAHLHRAAGHFSAAHTALSRAESIFLRQGNVVGIARIGVHRARLALLEPAAPHSEVLEDTRRARNVFRNNRLLLPELQADLALAELRIRLGQNPTAALNRMRAVTQRNGCVPVIWRLEWTMARLALALGRPRAARLRYHRAVQTIEAHRNTLRGEDLRRAYFEDKLQLLDEYLQLLLEEPVAGSVEHAFQVVEQSRSRTLLDRLARLDREAPNRPELRQEIEQHERLFAELREAYGDRDDPVGALRRIVLPEPLSDQRLAELERQVTGSDDLVGIPLPAPPASSRAPDLTHREVVLAYWTVQDEVLAFIIDGKKVKLLRGLASRREVEQLVARLRQSLGRTGADARFAAAAERTTRATLRALSERLLEPIASELTTRRLVIMPVGVMHGIPFAALPVGDECAGDRWEITHAPGLGIYSLCARRQRRRDVPSLVVGVPEPDLPYVRQEVRAIETLVPNTVTLFGQEAVYAAIPTEGEYNFIHFATHAMFRSDNPFFSGLKLADGWLLGCDLYRRNLRCRVAVLAACRTGAVQVAPGEELLGLARCFLAAGARSVLVSLWDANDAVTAALMGCFYARAASGAAPAVALREAQTLVRQRWPDPFHWAAFVLVGAGWDAEPPPPRAGKLKRRKEPTR